MSKFDEEAKQLIAEGKIQYPVWLYNAPDIRRAQDMWRQTFECRGMVLRLRLQELFDAFWAELPWLKKAIFKVITATDRFIFNPKRRGLPRQQ